MTNIIILCTGCLTISSMYKRVLSYMCINQIKNKICKYYETKGIQSQIALIRHHTFLLTLLRYHPFWRFSKRHTQNRWTAGDFYPTVKWITLICSMHTACTIIVGIIIKSQYHLTAIYDANHIIAAWLFTFGEISSWNNSIQVTRNTFLCDIVHWICRGR